MAYDSTFTPRGPTFLIDANGPYQVTPYDEVQGTSYRIKNLGSSEAYIAWAVPIGAQSTTKPTITITAPTVNNPATNQIKMQANGVETLGLPRNAWFQAGAGASFEVTAGEGL